VFVKIGVHCARGSDVLVVSSRMKLPLKGPSTAVEFRPMVAAVIGYVGPKE